MLRAVTFLICLLVVVIDVDKGVVNLGPIVHAQKPLPPGRPVGPQTQGPACSKYGTPVSGSLTVKRKDRDTIEGHVVTPSASCKPKLGGGIVGDRIEIEVWDGGDTPGTAACTCSFVFTQAIKPESKLVNARVRGGPHLGQIAVPN